MRKIVLNCFALICLTLFVEKAQAQVYDSVLNIYEEQYPHEKIHIHFDRTIYNFTEGQKGDLGEKYHQFFSIYITLLINHINH